MGRVKLALATAVLAMSVAGCGYFDFGRSGPSGAYQHGDAYAAYGRPKTGRWGVEAEVANEGGSSSTFHRGQVVAGALTIEGRDYGDTHEAGPRIALRGSRNNGRNTDVFVGVNYAKLDSAGPLVVGAVSVDPIIASFDDYEKIGVEVGARRYFGPNYEDVRPGQARPFVGVSAGLAHVSEIDARFESGTVGDCCSGFARLGTGLPNVINAEFYDASWVPTGALTAGVALKVARHASVEFETGVQVDGGLDEDDATLPLLGVAQINDGGTRVTIPVALRGKFRF